MNRFLFAIAEWKVCMTKADEKTPVTWPDYTLFLRANGERWICLKDATSLIDSLLAENERLRKELRAAKTLDALISDNGQVCELYDDIEALEAKLAAEKAKTTKLVAALNFYANGEHFIDHGGANFTPDGSCCPFYQDAENPSGEPVNYLEGHGDYGIEDGTIARKALAEFEKES